MAGLDWVLILEITLFFLWFVFIFYRYIIKKEENISFKYVLVIVENQERIIEDIIGKGISFLHRFAEHSQLVIIDMYSQDLTWPIIARLAYPKNNFSVYRFDTNGDLNRFLSTYNKKTLVLDYRKLNEKNPRGR
jgi:hypothetical protein